jgi:hypothetical protein
MTILYGLIGISLHYNPNQTLICIVENKHRADRILSLLKGYNSYRPIYCGLGDCDAAKEHGKQLADWVKHHPVFTKEIKTNSKDITTVFDDYIIVPCGLIEGE